MKPTLHYSISAAKQTIDEYGEIASRAFNFDFAGWDSYSERVGHENIRTVDHQGKLAGGLLIYRLGQWFGGKRLKMAGIACVAISPEHRGAGISTFLLSNMLRDLYDDGTALSTLFASTQTPYRKVGYEQAGNYCEHEMALTSIGPLRQQLPMFAIDENDRDSLVALSERRSRTTNGNLDRSSAIWKRIFDARNNPTPVYAYIVGEASSPEGYLVYTQHERPGDKRCVGVRDMYATSRIAAETIWSFLGSHRSNFGTVLWPGPCVDPMLLLTLEEDSRLVKRQRWMLRIVNVEKALSERGYQKNCHAELHLEIHDRQISENDGRFVLQIQDGNATVRRGGNGDLQMDVAALSPLYSSLVQPSFLADHGLIQGDRQTIDNAEQIFSASEAWMPDAF